MTFRRRSLLGSCNSPAKTPRSTAQSLRRKAMLNTVKQLTRASIGGATPSGVQFGVASKANLKVVVRVRPMNQKEEENNARYSLSNCMYSVFHLIDKLCYILHIF